MAEKKSDFVRLEMMWSVIDWISSSAKQTMNLKEQGAYRNILDAMWMAGGKLLNKNRVLFHASGADSMQEWVSVRRAVLAQLTIETVSEGDRTPIGFVSQRRLTQQLMRIERLSEAKRAAAKSMWNQRKPDAGAYATSAKSASAKPMPNTNTNTNTNIKTKERAMPKISPPQGCTQHPTSGITDKGDCYGCYAELVSKPKPPCSQHPHSGITDKGMCYGCYRESFTPIPGRAN